MDGDAALARLHFVDRQVNKTRHRNHAAARAGKLAAALRRRFASATQHVHSKIKEHNIRHATRNQDIIPIDQSHAPAQRRLKTGVRGKGAYRKWTAGAILRVTSVPELIDVS